MADANGTRVVDALRIAVVNESSNRAPSASDARTARRASARSVSRTPAIVSATSPAPMHSARSNGWRIDGAENDTRYTGRKATTAREGDDATTRKRTFDRLGAYDTSSQRARLDTHYPTDVARLKKVPRNEHSGAVFHGSAMKVSSDRRQVLKRQEADASSHRPPCSSALTGNRRCLASAS